MLISVNARAQVVVQAGPHLGLNAATATYTADDHSFSPRYVGRPEAGVTGQASRGHLAVQASALYAPKGFQLKEDYVVVLQGVTTQVKIRETYRLNYLTFPVSLAYARRADGQGLQVFGGGYLGVLLGGQREYNNSRTAEPNDQGVYSYATLSGSKSTILPSKRLADYPRPANLNDYLYSRRLDAGVQAGLGYRRAGWLVQLGYSVGLTNQVPEFPRYGLVSVRQQVHRNRAAQLSATYLLGRRG
jgi:hypothetical protein